MTDKKGDLTTKTYVSVRLTDIVRQQLADLVSKLGENQSRVIIRALAEAHAKYCETKPLPNP